MAAAAAASNPWSFFKEIFVINLKHDVEKLATFKARMAAYEGLNITVVEGVPGRTNPYLRESYKERNIIGDHGAATLSDGMLGCIASHRHIWESVMLRANSKTPFWILVFEDDALFHPLFDNDVLASYLETVPSDALQLRFGFLALPHYCANYKRVNAHWLDFQNTQAFATNCYALRSDVLSSLLRFKFDCNIDHIIIPRSYGAVDLEVSQELGREEVAKHVEFYRYYNAHIKDYEKFHGLAAAVQHDSGTV
jgi:GR25 family glycosyltransferase involved in LPS biosynthesis